MVQAPYIVRGALQGMERKVPAQTQQYKVGPPATHQPHGGQETGVGYLYHAPPRTRRKKRPRKSRDRQCPVEYMPLNTPTINLGDKPWGET